MAETPAGEEAAREPSPLTPVQQRVAWLVANKFGGKKSAMSKAIGFDPMAITRVVGGQRPPGRQMLTAIIEKLGVDPGWLMQGRGEAFPGGLPEDRLRAPLLRAVLATAITDREKTHAAESVNLLEFISETQYWLRLSTNDPILRCASGRFRSGDVLLFETDVSRYRHTSLSCDLCVIKNPAGPDPVAVLADVNYFPAESEDDAPSHLSAQVFDQHLWTAEVRQLIKYPSGEMTVSAPRMAVVADGQSEPQVLAGRHNLACPIEYRIEPKDIVAVWTGLMFRGTLRRPRSAPPDPDPTVRERKRRRDR